MKKFLLLVTLIVCLTYGGALAAPAEYAVLVVAPNVADFDWGRLKMPYFVKLATWNIDDYEVLSGVAFQEERFFAEYGYSRRIDLTGIMPDPDTSLAALLTGMKYRRAWGAALEPTIMEILEQERDWATFTTDDLAEALAILGDAIDSGSPNPFEAGTFVLALYWGNDGEELVRGVAEIVALVDRPNDYADWANTSVMITQGWGANGNPISLVANGNVVPSLMGYEGRWYEPGVIDNTQVYEAIGRAAYIPMWPKLRPVPAQSYSMNPYSSSPSVLWRWLLR